jgi:hypothetical protein
VITIRFWRDGGWRFKITSRVWGYVSAPYPSLRAAAGGAWRARKQAAS